MSRSSRRRKSKRRKPTLPPIPAGNEWQDMLWRDTADLASDVLATLPEDVPDEWATAQGAGALTCTLLREIAARRELARTGRSSPLRRLRYRAVQYEVRLGRAQAGCVAAAIVRGIRRDHPKAQPEQVWLVLRERLRMALEAWLLTPEGIEVLEGLVS